MPDNVKADYPFSELFQTVGWNLYFICVAVASYLYKGGIYWCSLLVSFIGHIACMASHLQPVLIAVTEEVQH